MRFVTIALVGALAACTTAQTNNAVTSVNTTLATAKSDLATAINFYGIVKGTAQVAISADPALGAKITPVINTLDSVLAGAQLALADATATAPELEALAKQLQQQSASVLATAAPAIKVVASH